MTGRLENSIALVTGASRGIGYAVARAYAREGAHVIATARTSGGLEELDDEITGASGSVTLVPLDLTDYDAIDRLGGVIFERWGRLDILVGNAGILGTLTPVGHIKPDEWRAVLDLNLTANWRLIRAMHTLLQQSNAGRAIFVTSGAAENCRPFWGEYSISKAALDALVKTYAHENENTALRVNLINPGPMRTAMRAKAMPGEDPQTLPDPDQITDLFIDLASPEETRTGEIIQFRK